ncbi:LANO_0G01728g1_1 [Lachancea nothofagi CBS 11611]|uniref:LANO_0G01728g1_1 n=1 Tax=Lachancea nothofagi CBS 11611 TaxID=1266666 RepID=A0A1G4KEX8_9SACH|nr:LANO_0G01728g1_1 [Lachancea nothofagi CBS 11611]
MTKTTEINQETRYKLNNGLEIPIIGFGVYEIPAADTADLVYQALKEGYRHIDTAVGYRNQAQAALGVRRFLNETGALRESVWCTTKLTNQQQGWEETQKALKEIAKDVAEAISYVDLVLLHSPKTSSRKRLDSWKVLEEAVIKPESSAIPIKAIGVSNFGVPHLQELLAAARIKPVLNQLELHPWLPRPELRKFLKDNDILAEAYSPLTQGVKLQDPELLSLETQSGISKAELLLNWSFLQGFVVLVKSAKPKRILDNLKVLPKKGEDRKVFLSDDIWQALDKPNSHDVVTWNKQDPTEFPIDIK